MATITEAEFVGVHLYLRTSQAAFIENLAEIQSVDESRALWRLINKRIANSPASSPTDPALKQRKHLKICSRHLTYIENLSVQWGLGRSDTVRRIIDEALLELQNADTALRGVA